VGLVRRLYRGETNFDFIGARKRWYLVTLVLLVICVGSMAIKGFSWGIQFAGGTTFLMPKPAGTTISQVEEVVRSVGVKNEPIQEVGSGSSAKYLVNTPPLNVDQVEEVKDALARDLKLPSANITDSAVSSSWGSQVTRQALIALAVFLVLVSAYLWIRFEPKMAAAAILALLHDLLLTAGAYSLVGFEVTPPTIVGLLTILGFSLYDTVVVFDKVAENTKGILGSGRMTYGEAANLAVNQTLMRSINTSLVSLLPVAGLLFVGAGLLGVGTLKDLALVLFIGLAAGAYSSLFLATPWLVEMKEREPRFAALAQRVAARRQESGRPATTGGGSEAASERQPARPVVAAGSHSGASGSGARRRPSGKGSRPGTKRRR
jgi:preprotein translocase subunit SecF